MMRALRLAAVVVVLALAALAGAAAWWVGKPLELAAPTVEYSVEAGASPRAVAQGWVDAGVRAPAWLLYQWFRWSGSARQIRAGSYEIAVPITPAQLLDKMVRGDEALATVRLIEGWTFRQVRAELAKAPALRATTTGMSDAELMRAIGAGATPPEGRFFPDTYAYARGSADVEVLRRAYRAMERRLAAAWSERAPGLPLASPDDALTLASLVEKETGIDADRGRIAGVFANRLRKGMPLQTDPSVIYGLGERFDGNLRKRDLTTDGPYNTYTRAGLPPTPIAIPGMASLIAATRPEPTRALYFVARGDGSSEFSETLGDHNRAVNRYQRGGRAGGGS